MIEYLYAGMLLISIVLIYFAFRNYNTTKNLMTDGVKTKARVIDLIEVEGNDGYTYTPVFEYNDNANNIVKFESRISSNPPRYSVGEMVNIIYSKDTEEKKIISFWGLYRWAIILLSIASPLLVIGGAYILYSRG